MIVKLDHRFKPKLFTKMIRAINEHNIRAFGEQFVNTTNLQT